MWPWYSYLTIAAGCSCSLALLCWADVYNFTISRFPIINIFLDLISSVEPEIHFNIYVSNLTQKSLNLTKLVQKYFRFIHLDHFGKSHQISGRKKKCYLGFFYCSKTWMGPIWPKRYVKGSWKPDVFIVWFTVWWPVSSLVILSQQWVTRHQLGEVH